MGDEAATEGSLRHCLADGAEVGDDYEAFAQAAVAEAQESAAYVKGMAPKLYELARSEARRYSILLSKISDAAASRLYAGCPGENIKYVSVKTFEKFVDSVVSDELFNDTLLDPVVREFWIGWREGGTLRAKWQRYRWMRQRPAAELACVGA